MHPRRWLLRAGQPVEPDSAVLTASASMAPIVPRSRAARRYGSTRRVA